MLLDLPPTIPAAAGLGVSNAPGVARGRENRSDRNPPASPIDPAHPAFRLCREITRSRARNFYLGLSLAPEPRRSALLALYTWMRHADDLADSSGPADSPETRRAAIADLRHRTESATSGGETSGQGDPGWWPAFVSTINAYPIPPSVFSDTLDALDADAGGVELQTDADVARYADRVAGTVAVACVAIWGLRRPENERRALRLAITRARAVQLTNILRDLREDLLLTPRRSYLPQDSYHALGMEPENLLRWDPPELCEELMGRWIAQARALYSASRDLESLIDPSCARVSWSLAEVYRELLETIARDPSRVARERVSVPQVRKISIALSGWLGVGLPG